MRDMSGTAKDTANSGIGEGATTSIGSEGPAANANTTCVAILLTTRH